MRYLTLATLAAAAATLAGAPAVAQTVLEEVTITAHGLKNEEMSKSQRVSFADLDLTRKADRDKLGLRVADTAHRLCEELNEPGPRSPGAFGHSCQEIATRKGLEDVKVAVAAARGGAYADNAFSQGWSAPAAGSYSAPASATAPASANYIDMTVTNGPVADTPENRARYGGPMSNAGKRTAPRGN